VASLTDAETHVTNRCHDGVARRGGRTAAVFVHPRAHTDPRRGDVDRQRPARRPDHDLAAPVIGAALYPVDVGALGLQPTATDLARRQKLAGDGAVSIEWETEPRTASFDLQWLLAQAPNRRTNRPECTRRRWLKGADLDAARDFAWAAFSAAQNDRALRALWLERLLQDGIAFLSGAPANDNGILDAAAKSFVEKKAE